MALTPSEYYETETYKSASSTVDIKGYSSSNKYVPQKDGYLYVYSSANPAGYVRLIDSDHGSIGGITDGRFLCFIKKGTPIYPDGTLTYAWFTPINY